MLVAAVMAVAGKRGQTKGVGVRHRCEQSKGNNTNKVQEFEVRCGWIEMATVETGCVVVTGYDGWKGGRALQASKKV